MLSVLRVATSSLVALLLAATTLAQTAGTISAPAAGTLITPGQSFDFSYSSHADYGISSYNYTVWLTTTPPTSMAQSDTFMTGHYFGRFSEPNYPGNPNPTNAPPAQLVMPNFSVSPGGFGAGKNATNATCYFVVLEEWADGTGVLGNKISLHYNEVIYG